MEANVKPPLKVDYRRWYGPELRRARKEAGLTQKRLAELCGSGWYTVRICRLEKTAFFDLPAGEMAALLTALKREI